MTSYARSARRRPGSRRSTRARRGSSCRGRSPTTRGDKLTEREREILDLIADGLATKVIARRLGIAEPTVRKHLTSIYRQIGVTDRTQAALWAVEHGMGTK